MAKKMNAGDAIVFLGVDLSKWGRAWAQAKRDTNKKLGDISRLVNSAGRGMVATGDAIGGVSRKILGYTAGAVTGFVGIAASVVKMQSDFETAFTGVRKTVDATDAEFAALESGLIDMSTRIPQSASALANIMEIAGQMGIRGVDNLMSFTETMAMLADTTNIVGEDGSLQMSKFMGVMQVSTDDVGKLGSALVDLGNKFAARENEILETSQSLAGFGSQIGLTAPQLMALAATIRLSGGESQAASTAFQKLGLTMKDSVLLGTKELDVFARVSGMTADQFSKQFKENAMGAIVSFIGGLKRINDSGQSTTQVLAELGLADQRLIREIGLVTANHDKLIATLGVSNQAYNKNTALTEEAGKRYGTFASQLKLLWTNIQAPLLRLSGTVLPKLTSALRDDVIPMVQSWADYMVANSDLIKAKVADFIDAAVLKFKDLIKWIKDNKEEIKDTGRFVIKLASELGLLIVKLAAVGVVIGPIIAALGNLTLVGMGAVKMFATFNGWLKALSAAKTAAGFIAPLIGAASGPFAGLGFMGIVTALGLLVGAGAIGWKVGTWISELINKTKIVNQVFDWWYDRIYDLVEILGKLWQKLKAVVGLQSELHGDDLLGDATKDKQRDGSVPTQRMGTGRGATSQSGGGGLAGSLGRFASSMVLPTPAYAMAGGPSMSSGGGDNISLTINMPGMVIREEADIKKLTQEMYRGAKDALLKKGRV